MSIVKVNDIFLEKEINQIKNIISGISPILHEGLGRIDIFGIENHFPKDIVDKVNNIVESISDLPLKMRHAMSVEYSTLYGKPNLPPHLDVDTNDLIVNIQLESNTVWNMGLNLKTYTLEDNSALIFNANKEIHWRVHKEFKDGEYVKMLFIRYFNPEVLSNYSHLPTHPDNEMFADTRKFRDSLGIF